MNQGPILVWLPTPMGDAILCTPALRAIRNHFHQQIYFLANPTVRQVLSPCSFNDRWIETSNDNVFTLARRLGKFKFSSVILLKNSFGSALTAFIAGISRRIGYARDGRSLFLTEMITPQKSPDGDFKPVTMIDYYLHLAEYMGCDTGDRRTELLIDEKDAENLPAKLPVLFSDHGPLVILVPGGAFGPSKHWPADRFAQTADYLIKKYKARIVVSVAANEKNIAEKICNRSENSLCNLAETPLPLGLLKALFAKADMVITNDTGPRHIAIALGRNVITLFGPNNPLWTQTDCQCEIQLPGQAPCVPCQKPKCRQKQHLCMESISTQTVCHVADKFLDNSGDKPDHE